MIEMPVDLGLHSTVGNSDILNRRKIALICSVKCPGGVILQTYELMKGVRGESVTVISGFHSPMERECLNVLLKGTCGIVICYARTIPKRVPSEFRQAIDAGRMLLISPFLDKHNRVTSETSVQRNRFIAALSDVVFVPYAAAGGKTEALCREIVRQGKPLFTLLGEYTANLAKIGVRQMTMHSAVSEMMGSEGSE